MANPGTRYDYLTYRMGALPTLIETTERKLVGLYREAARYRMDDVLARPSAITEAWEREVMIARLKAAEDGQPTSLIDVANCEDIDE